MAYEENVAVAVGRPYQKALATNANSASFPSKVPTVTEPTSDGVVDLLNAGTGLTVPRAVKVLPYGAGSDNDVYDLRLIGWRRIKGTTPQTTLWVPTVLVEVTCTLSGAVGVAGSPVLATERFADTVTIKAAGWEATTTADTTRAGSVLIFSPQNDLPAWFVIELNGEEKVEFTFDQTTGTPTGNCLIALL